MCRISCEPGYTVLMTVAGSVPRWGSAGYGLVWGGLDQDNRTLVLQQAGRPQSWCSVMARKQVARPAWMKERAIDSIAFGEGLQSDGAERDPGSPPSGSPPPSEPAACSCAEPRAPLPALQGQNGPHASPQTRCPAQAAGGQRPSALLPVPEAPTVTSVEGAPLPWESWLFKGKACEQETGAGKHTLSLPALFINTPFA